MRYGHRLVMTTTSSLQGWEIVDYLGPVSAQFVIGTGLFADFFSSWTDFFGAHSRSYEKKLDRINEEALKRIEEKAGRMGATGVLGLRVDHDEISGAGKSMLMVTASGTAVKAHRISDTESLETTQLRTNAISGASLQTLVRRREVLEKAESYQLKLGDEDTWRFILDNEMDELSTYVLRVVKNFLEGTYQPEKKEFLTQKYTEYFLVISPEKAKEVLYPCLKASKRVWQFALRVIRKGNLFDTNRVLGYLRGSDGTAKKRSVQLLLADSEYYSVEDISALESLKEEIKKQFIPKEVHSKKGMLGSKEVWDCECGAHCKPSQARCTNCNRDRYGFTSQMMNPEQALEIVGHKLAVLKAQLQST